MKLKNKKTVEIGNLLPYGGEDGKIWVWIDNKSRPEYRYNSLAELNEEWEDAAEEPEMFYWIDYDGKICKAEIGTMDRTKIKEIGNYFETKEEAEKAVEKLKAWKRLRDGGITFKNWTINQTGTIDCFATWGDNIPPSRKNPTLLDDLDLLFGGENE